MNTDTSDKISEVIDAAMKALRSGQPDSEVRGIVESASKELPEALVAKVRAMVEKLLVQRAQNERLIKEIYDLEWQLIDQEVKATAQNIRSIDAVKKLATRTLDKFITPPIKNNSNKRPK